MAAAAIILHPATPNPFNPATTISFDLPCPTHATVTIHDLRGRRLVTLLDTPRPAGRHILSWRGTDDAGRALPSGAYLVRLTTESAIRTTKAVLLR
ncbi:MAG TPA: FlgD immunoglobulin-like domain containing protein [Candidatus Krumholzibacteria bacterium]|nr:FlgD immunoglobulin-like domain containing protein [Candidatus Krumholzibacteria bacterium]HPD71127.1 FlgD immunoglobulin-like domain containing protein [Candidatus Krumholzibacteria bacterium]HRY39173.1 FlgD immunoglobulin-like domain containing protein [Candidatus Krumholzibacteria bacterium]